MAIAVDTRPKIEALSEINQDEALKLAITDPLDNSLIIADLTQLKADCSIFIKNRSGKPSAIASYYRDLPFNSIALKIKNSEDIIELIGELANNYPKLKEEPIFGLYNEKTAKYIQQCFEVENVIVELQMALCRSPISDILFDKSQYRLERLTTDDLVQISYLYSLVPAMAWTPKALAFGPCYGVYYRDKLVSIAGVHFLTKWAAEIGNIVTHPKHRRLNLAYACTKAVADALVENTQNVFLCVVEDNEPAVKLYEKMGFVTHQKLYMLRYRID
jgi:GNAT superfamily N-acetyltransferase